MRLTQCVIKSLTGIDCPGCGSQRAFSALLHADFIASFKFYPPLIPLLIMFGFLAFHLLKGVNNGARYLKYMFIANAIIIVANYIVKLMHAH
jgi:hypothetical protein